MAPRKKTTGIETVDETESHLAAPHQGISADDLSPDTLLALDELGASVSAVVIERKNDNGADWDYMARLSAAEYRTEYIKEQFGGGEYRVTIIDEVRGRLNPVRVSVDKRFVGKMFANTATPVHSAGVANDPFRDRLLEVLLAKALTPAQANSSRETIELVLAVVGAVKGNDGGNVLEQMKTMFDMSKQMADMSNPPEGIAGIAANYLPVIERMVSSQRPTARVVQRTTPPALPAPAPVATVAPTLTAQPVAIVTPPASEPAHVAGSIVPKWLEPFKSYAKQLVKIADRGSDPTMYADLALEEIQDNEDTFVAAVEAMQADRLLTDLFAVCPELEKTEQRKEFANAFVDAFKSGVTEILNSAEDEDAAEAGGT